MTVPTALTEKWRNWFRLYLNRLLERWTNIGLRTKMGAIVVAGLVGLMTIFSLLGISTASQVAGQVLDERMAIAHLVADNLDATIHHIQRVLPVVASQQALRDSQASPEERATALQTGFDLIANSSEGVYLFDPVGQLLTSVTESKSDFDWSGATAIQNALVTGQSHLSLIIEGQPRAMIAIPVLGSETGEPVGVLAAVLNLNELGLSLFDHPFDLGRTGTLDVVDPNGVILMSTQPERVLAVTEQADLVSELFVVDEPTVETCVGCANGEMADSTAQVVSFAPMLQAPWGVLVQQDSDEVFAPVSRLKLLTLLLGLAAVVGALGLVWVTTNSVVAPVQLLTAAATRIARGDLTTPVGCQRGDEIGELSASFDTMRLQLKSSIEEIQALNQELDARVNERTQAALTAQFEAQGARDDLRAIIDGLSDELIVVGLDRRIQQINQTAQAQYAAVGDVVGHNCYEVLQLGLPCQPSDCECPIPKVVESGQPVKVTHIHRQPGNGGDRYIDIVASPMRDPNGNVTRVIELRRDVTEEKKMEASLVRRNQQLSILNAVATTVNQSLDLGDILGKALDEVLRLTGIDMGAIFLQEERLGNLELLAHRGLSEEAARMAARMGMLDGSCGGVIEAGQVVVVPDLSRYRGRRADSLKRERLTTLVHVPLAAKGCILGSICVGTRNKREFNAEEQELLTAIGSQIAVAIENARLYAEVQHKEQLRGQLLNKLITVQEEERKRIARELHDDTSQALAALLFTVEEVLEMEQLTEMKARLEGMRELTMQSMEEIYKLIFDLRPTMLDHLGLVPALRSFAQSRLEPAGIRVTIEEATVPYRLPAEVETALFRVVQEVITNVARHAVARNVHIFFQFDPDSVTVNVEDDGVGFDMVEVTLSPDSQCGLGLMGMFERVELLGGRMDIDTAPGYGTQISIQVPIKLVERITSEKANLSERGRVYA